MSRVVLNRDRCIGQSREWRREETQGRYDLRKKRQLRDMGENDDPGVFMSRKRTL